MISADTLTAVVHLAGFGTGAALGGLRRRRRLERIDGRGAEFSFGARRGEGTTVMLTLPTDAAPVAAPATPLASAPTLTREPTSRPRHTRARAVPLRRVS